MSWSLKEVSRATQRGEVTGWVLPPVGRGVQTSGLSGDRDSFCSCHQCAGALAARSDAALEAPVTGRLVGEATVVALVAPGQGQVSRDLEASRGTGELTCISPPFFGLSRRWWVD